jgi:hypothetical protein
MDIPTNGKFDVLGSVSCPTVKGEFKFADHQCTQASLQPPNSDADEHRVDTSTETFDTTITRCWA